jgi:Dyp-type peroxidase family
MPGTVDLTTELVPFNPANATYADLLKNLQGNILTSHGRHFAMHIFFRFNADIAAAKAAIVKLRAAGFVTSAAEQDAQTQRRQANPGHQEIFGCLLLSATGLKALGLDVPSGFGNSAPLPGPPVNFTFDQPMSAAAAELGDKPDQDWEPQYNQQIDGLLIVAYGNADTDNTQPILNQLFAQAKAARIMLETGATVVAVETGHAHVLDKQPREHFGFVDGISQPLYRTTDLPPGPTDAFDPGAGLISLLVADPFSAEPDAFASFFVFRKLEQNVAGWRQAVVATAAKLGQTPPQIGAMAVGRYQNGDPVIFPPTGPHPQNPIPNNFDYAGDKAGLKCPYHGHIRKANPRGDTDRNFGSGTGALTEVERKRRIARRGITYGDRAPDLSDAPVNGVGLLFMCYQANIPDQFGFMQKNWVNQDNFARPSPQAGQDAVIGQGSHTVQQVWPTGTLDDFGKFVTSRGGEFFLAVSIPTIEALAS